MKYILFFSLFLMHKTFAQKCNCTEQFKNISESVKDDYVAFNEKVSAKGKVNYSTFLKKMTTKAMQAQNEYTCAKVLKEYIYFFEEPHFNLVLKTDSITTAAFSKIFKNFPRKQIDEDSLRIELARGKHEFVEGLWETVGIGYYKIAIIKVKNRFDAIVLKTNSPLWFTGQKKIELHLDENKTKGTAQFYGRDHIGRKVNFVISGNVMNFPGYGYFKKIYPVVHSKQTAFRIEQFFEFKKLDNNTCYLAFPSFDLKYADTIARLVDSVKPIIENVKFLIVDLRDNGGGYSYVYSPLVPYVYTAPIIKPPFYMKSSVNNNKLYEKHVVGVLGDSESREILKKLKSNIGALVRIKDGDTIFFSETKNKPGQIIFLVNGNTASAAEDLLLIAQKSSKAIVAGQNTRGAFDHRDVLGPREMVSSFYNFFCPVGKNIGEVEIDNVGIKPDFIIGYDVGDWIEYVMANIIKSK